MTVLHLFRKEFNGFFASPAAWLFLGGFLLSSFFVVFWGESFFARNLADLKPLFSWIPILMIFLVAALTMRSWSEERRAGTIETLMTSPLSLPTLIVGKFLAILALVILALVLTFPLPITVSMLGDMDWGPVIGGYFASLFLAAAYIAIGLYTSARTDNAIVALIMTSAICGGLYLIGSHFLTSLFGHDVASLLSLIGSGSRFESITRGVIDIRDILYYLSIVVVFLLLNGHDLSRIKWAGNPSASGKHGQKRLFVGLVVVNILLLNGWMNSVGWARVDLTADHRYTLSSATRQTLQELREPLLIRGYFSAKTHPLLEPLVPQIKDLLKEYQVAGGEHVRVEFIDPHRDQALEEEAAEKYGVRPVPFRMASRYQAGVVNSYFNLVIAYGDQYESLSFEDLIEVRAGGAEDIDVILKNPEYAITRSIRKVARSFESGSDLLATLTHPVEFVGYFSPDQKLPDFLRDFRKIVSSTVEDLAKKSDGKIKINIVDPDAGNGDVAQQIRKDYGFAPQVASLLDPTTFWFYMVLKNGDDVVQIPIPEEMNESGFKKILQSALQRMSPGYLKTVALYTPPSTPNRSMMGLGMSGGKTYRDLRDRLSENYRVVDAPLDQGRVPGDADILLLMGPDHLTDKQLFAVDQFLMQGGTVLVATSPYDVEISRTLTATSHTSGLESWLAHYGLEIKNRLILDNQHASLPVPVPRQIGPITVNEIHMMAYPPFPDIRGEGLNRSNPVTASLQQIVMNWVSPIGIQEDKTPSKPVVLMRTSPESWLLDSTNILPDYIRYPDTGFPVGQEQSSYPIAVSVEGRFESFFKGKPSPLLEDNKADDKEQDKKTDQAAEKIDTRIIEHSPDHARLVLLSSNTFASDAVLRLISQGMGTQYTRPLELVQNILDWSLDDQGLMAIRSRAQYARTLKPMELSERQFWEYANYIAALIGLVIVWGVRFVLRRRRLNQHQLILAEV